MCETHVRFLRPLTDMGKFQADRPAPVEAEPPALGYVLFVLVFFVILAVVFGPWWGKLFCAYLTWVLSGGSSRASLVTLLTRNDGFADICCGFTP